MFDKPVELISQNNSNFLGLKKAEDQRPNSRLESRRFPWISRSGMTPRLDILREAYLAIYKHYKNPIDAEDAPYLEHILKSLSSSTENPFDGLTNAIQAVLIDKQPHCVGNLDRDPQEFKAELIRKYPKSVGKLHKRLTREDRRQFQEFDYILGDAQRNNGVLWVSGSRNRPLSNILTCFTYLYGTNPQDNPLMHNYGGKTSETPQDMLFRKLIKEKADTNLSENRRKAIEQYMERISGAIIRLIQMTPQELEQTFPDDNVKHKAIVKKLKTEFNRLAVQVHYNFRFENQLDDFNDKSEKYLLRKLRPDDEYYRVLEAKFSWRLKKKVLTVLAIVFALFIAAGQASIAVFALTSAVAMVGIGAASFVTNTLLFFRDIRAMLISIFSGRLFNGMNGYLQAFVGLFFGCSFVTGIVIGGLAFVALIGVFGISVISTAPWWLIAVAGVVGGLTVVGITALMFMAGVSLVRALRGNTLRSLIINALQSIKSFFETPQFNQSLVDLIKERRSLQEKLNTLSDLSNEELSKETPQELQAKISAITQEIRIGKMYHYVRHFTKVIVKTVLVPFAIVAAVVATVALLRVSAKATAATLKLLISSLTESVSTLVANILTWIPALIVRGTLNIKNLVNAAGFVAAKIGKVVSGVAYTVGRIGSLARQGLLLKTIKESFQAVNNNPLKVIVTGIRTAISGVLSLLVALNGYGNGQTAEKGGNMFIPLLSFLPEWIIGHIGIFSALCGSAVSSSVNLMSANNTTATNTPIQNLDKMAVPPTEDDRKKDQDDEELRPWGAAKPGNKGSSMWGFVQNVQLGVRTTKNKWTQVSHDETERLLGPTTSDHEQFSMENNNDIHDDHHDQILLESNNDIRNKPSYVVEIDQIPYIPSLCG